MRQSRCCSGTFCRYCSTTADRICRNALNAASKISITKYDNTERNKFSRGGLSADSKVIVVIYGGRPDLSGRLSVFGNTRAEFSRTRRNAKIGKQKKPENADSEADRQRQATARPSANPTARPVRPTVQATRPPRSSFPQRPLQRKCPAGFAGHWEQSVRRRRKAAPTIQPYEKC